MKSILEAIENNADTKAFEALPIPESYRAAVVRKDEQEMFAGVPTWESSRVLTLSPRRRGAVPAKPDTGVPHEGQHTSGFNNRAGKILGAIRLAAMLESMPRYPCSSSSWSASISIKSC